MAAILVPFLLSVLFVVSIAIYAHRRTRVRMQRLSPDWLTGWSIIALFILMTPVAGIATAFVHEWLHPTDDWGAFVGGSGCVVQFLLVPFVAYAVWTIVHLYDRRLQPKYAHLCRRCRHELTGATCEPDSAEPLGRCPECGLLQSIAAAGRRTIGSRQ